MCVSNTVRRRSLNLTALERGDTVTAPHNGYLGAGGLKRVTMKCLSTAPTPQSLANVTPLVAPGHLPVPHTFPSEAHKELILSSLAKDNAAMRSNQHLIHHTRPYQFKGKTGYTTIANAAPSRLVKKITRKTLTFTQDQLMDNRDPRIDRPYRDYAFESPSVEKYVTRGGVTEPFPLKLHRMLDQIDTDGHGSIVGWQTHGRCCKSVRSCVFVGIV